MQRLKRLFAIDIEIYPGCGGTLRVMACIETPPLIAKILQPQGGVRLIVGALPLQAKNRGTGDWLRRMGAII